MGKEFQTNINDLLLAYSEALDLIDIRLANHHSDVAYISSVIAEEMNLLPDDKINIILAALLHDIGVFTLKEKVETASFDVIDEEKHALVGYAVLNANPFFSDIAKMIRFHHRKWNNGKNNDENIPLGSYIIYLADRISILINKKNPILSQVQNIVEIIEEGFGSRFRPELVEVFRKISQKESFWLDISSSYAKTVLKKKMAGLNSKKLTLEQLLSVAPIFVHGIDFRSTFTAAHSIGVACSAEKIAQFSGMSIEEQKIMKVAGYFHDIGKLAIPTEILNKPGALDNSEINIIKSHTYYTNMILEDVEGFEEIREIASFHHERVNGRGYPFKIGHEALSYKARIMAVADIFTAITEDRPYRKAMEKENALMILDNMSEIGQIDSSVVEIVRNNYDKIKEYHTINQIFAYNDFRRFQKELSDLWEN